jgi:hypothetical protein
VSFGAIGTQTRKVWSVAVVELAESGRSAVNAGSGWACCYQTVPEMGLSDRPYGMRLRRPPPPPPLRGGCVQLNSAVTIIHEARHRVTRCDPCSGFDRHP